MRLVFSFIISILYISCSAGRIHLHNTFSVKQVSGGYSKISDSVFTLETKKLGRTYLNFIIDSCQRINSIEFNLVGYITFPEGMMNGHERKMPEVDILQVTEKEKQILNFMQYLGKTDQAGKFDIKVNAQNKNIVILLDKQNFTYTSVLLSF